jgi:hypothetical protein
MLTLFRKLLAEILKDIKISWVSALLKNFLDHAELLSQSKDLSYNYRK